MLVFKTSSFSPFRQRMLWYKREMQFSLLMVRVCYLHWTQISCTARTSKGKLILMCMSVCVAFPVLQVRQFPAPLRVSRTVLPLPRRPPRPLHPPTVQQPQQQQSPASLSLRARSPLLLMAHLLWETMPGVRPGLWS